MHISEWGQGVMFANCVWFLWVYFHKREHLCVPRCKVNIIDHSATTAQPMEQYPRV